MGRWGIYYCRILLETLYRILSGGLEPQTQWKGNMPLLNRIPSPRRGKATFIDIHHGIGEYLHKNKSIGLQFQDDAENLNESQESRSKKMRLLSVTVNIVRVMTTFSSMHCLCLPVDLACLAVPKQPIKTFYLPMAGQYTYSYANTTMHHGEYGRMWLPSLRRWVAVQQGHVASPLGVLHVLEWWCEQYATVISAKITHTDELPLHGYLSSSGTEGRENATDDLLSSTPVTNQTY